MWQFLDQEANETKDSIVESREITYRTQMSTGCAKDFVLGIKSHEKTSSTEKKIFKSKDQIWKYSNKAK